MGYATSPLGENVLVGSGGNVTTQVHTHYGPRSTGGTSGQNKTVGARDEVIIDFTGKDYNDIGGPLNVYVIPAGSMIRDVYMDVEEAFVVTGTTPALEVGTDGSEATNGFSVTEAQLEATASVNLTSALSGTWDSEAILAADTTIGFALSGTTPAVTDAGKARITIVYEKANRSTAPA